MTFQQVKALYIKSSNAKKSSDRLRSSGYSLVMKEYTKPRKKLEYYEDVDISLIAEELLEITEHLYNTTKLDKYRYQCKGISDCIITYASDIDISLALSSYKGELVESEIFRYLDSTSLKGKVKYSSIHSICELMKASIGE